MLVLEQVDRHSMLVIAHQHHQEDEKLTVMDADLRNATADAQRDLLLADLVNQPQGARAVPAHDLMADFVDIRLAFFRQRDAGRGRNNRPDAGGNQRSQLLADTSRLSLSSGGGGRVGLFRGYALRVAHIGPSYRLASFPLSS